MSPFLEKLLPYTVFTHCFYLFTSCTRIFSTSRLLWIVLKLTCRCLFYDFTSFLAYMQIWDHMVVFTVWATPVPITALQNGSTSLYSHQHHARGFLSAHTHKQFWSVVLIVAFNAEVRLWFTYPESLGMLKGLYTCRLFVCLLRNVYLVCCLFSNTVVIITTVLVILYCSAWVFTCFR